MSSNEPSRNLSAALYAAAGILFVIGAFSSGRPGFSAVGFAFIALGALMYLRRQPRKD